MDWMTLLRIEHKLDMIIRSMQSGVMLPSPLPSLQDSDHDTCPVCEQIYRWSMSAPTESVTRTCGCKAKITPVPGISSLISSPDEKEANDGRQESSRGSADGGRGVGAKG